MTQSLRDIPPPSGKLGVLLAGMGAVTSTFLAGVALVKKGIGRPFGSLSQLQTIRLGKRYEGRNPLIKDFIPLAELSDLVFGGWDALGRNLYETALQAGVLPENMLQHVRGELEGVLPWKAVFDRQYVRNLNGTFVKEIPNKMKQAQALIQDIERFKKEQGLKRLVILWCASTEIHLERSPVHESLGAFEKGLEENSPEIPPSMIYAYAALQTKTPYANGAPNLGAHIPALWELAEKNKVPIAGRDFKTGQTMMKTLVAPGLKMRMLGLHGWYSTNILGNLDGEVLADPLSFRAKEKSKISVLDTILEPKMYPELYGEYCHKVRIDYYPPRGDAKEGWDNIDLFGWLGLPMQIKINFLCRDSILAAPIVLDLALFLDLARRAGLSGIQEWLSFYFKSPMCRPDLEPEHDLFIQHLKLKNTLRLLMGEEVLDHSGLDYYEELPPGAGTAPPAQLLNKATPFQTS